MMKNVIVGVAIVFVLNACNNGKTNTESKDSSIVATSTKPIPGTPIKYDSSKRYIFLTWDDSPQPPGTTNCRKIFHEERIL